MNTNLLKTLLVLVVIVATIEAYAIWYLMSPVTNLKYFQWGEGYTDGFVTARGTWKGADADLAYPNSSIEIDCWREFKHCWMATGRLHEGKLITHMDLYAITKWNNNVVEAVDKAQCATTTYTFDRASETVTGIRRTTSATGFCEGVEKDPLVFKLTDSFE